MSDGRADQISTVAPSAQLVPQTFIKYYEIPQFFFLRVCPIWSAWQYSSYCDCRTTLTILKNFGGEI